MANNDSTNHAPGEETHIVITVGRQFGSGGRELGRRLASALHIGYYDKELLYSAAKRAGVTSSFFEKSDERAPSFFNGLFSFAMGFSPAATFAGATAISDDGLYSAQSDFIHSLAQQESCVIVGRTADYVLRDFPTLVSLFVHAPMEQCVARILAREPELTPEQARSRAERTNKLRAGYYNFYTDKTWGAASSYDLTLDTSLMPMDDIVDVIVEYVRRRFPRAFRPDGSLKSQEPS
ncbi:MAG: cytidylate kinase-like family protein [Muribaculaceae bacterium]|nr:cytidylate kinase-like family protein [Muribaculaceae bacterium]